MRRLLSACLFFIVLAIVSADVYPNTLSKISDNTTQQAQQNFIFTFWPIKIENKNSDLSIIDDMMSNGMNYATVQIAPSIIGEPFVVDKLNELRAKGYNIALEISAGYYEDQIVQVVNHDNQFLTAACLVQENCEHWNNPKQALDPSYVGPLWQNTLNYVINLLPIVNPQIVLYDVEHWKPTSSVESLFIPSPCSCPIISDGITQEVYENEWQQRGNDLNTQVTNYNSSLPVYFYNVLPVNGIRWLAYSDGSYYNNENGTFPNPVGTNPNPSLYVLPNLELLEKNIQDMDLKDALPWISFVYSYGVSNDEGGYVYFDKSVSREAGRMLRKAQAIGLIHFPNANKCDEWYEENNHPVDGYAYCLEHEKEIIAGFQEGLTYKETNKIKNGSFEAYKVKTDHDDWDLKRFIPVFWTFTDSFNGDDDSAVNLNLEQDPAEGTFSWRHTLSQSSQTRKIESATFSINAEETGNFRLNFSAKTNRFSKGSFIKASLIQTNNRANQSISKIDLGVFSTTTTWNQIIQSVELSEGTWKLILVLHNNSSDSITFYLDNISLKAKQKTFK
jgi:hypothetical protein